MTQIDIQQMEANPGAYLEQVAKGETVVICKDQRPIAELRPVAQAIQRPRPIGLGIGTGFIDPRAFEPLPDEIIESFYTSDLDLKDTHLENDG